jgi:hypothetical protein
VAEARFLHRGATPAWADARAKVDIESAGSGVERSSLSMFIPIPRAKLEQNAYEVLTINTKCKISSGQTVTCVANSSVFVNFHELQKEREV